MASTLEIPENLKTHLEANYILEKELGRGGMGVVYLATDRRLERQVAIKVLNLNKVANPSLAEEISERFQREAKVVAKLSHPNLVAVFDVGAFDKYQYMIMEFARGKALADFIEAGQKLPPALAASIGQQICNALATAHDAGVIHRDIKPANIILSDKGVAKLTDFGIAQLNQSDQEKLTQAGSLMGSILYASPEQVQDASMVDHRTDIYSLGVTLYELLSNASPYQGSQLSQIILEIMSPNPPLRLTDHVPDAPEALTAIIHQAMAKNPDARFLEIRAMGKALEQLMGHTPQSQAVPLEFVSPGTHRHPSHLGGQTTLLRRTQVNEESAKLLRDNTEWVLSVIETWKNEDLSHLNLKQVMQKVTEKDLLGKTLSGAVFIGNRFCLWLHQGQFVGATDLQSSAPAERIFRQLPEDSDQITLYFLQEESPLLPVMLSNILANKGKIRQSRLDSALVNLAPLVESFGTDNDALTGYVVCLAQNNVYYYGFEKGQQVLSAQAQPEPAEQDWRRLTQLVLQESLLMHVYELQPELVGPSLSQCLSQITLQVRYQDDNKTTLPGLLAKNDELLIHEVQEARDNLVLQIDSPLSAITLANTPYPLSEWLPQSSSWSVAQWLLKQYFFLLNSSGNTNTLKYVYTWLPAIDRFELEQNLPGEDGQHYGFTLVARGTLPKENHEKALILVRVGPGDHGSVKRFIDEVIQVKTALIKSGDIGGAIYIAEETFSTDSLKLFSERTVEPRKKGFGLGALDTLTRYKGFVRIGMKRGFHLNLIEQIADPQTGHNTYHVIAPLLQ